MNVMRGSTSGASSPIRRGSSCSSPVHSVLAIDADPGFAVGASPPLAGHDLGVVTIDGCGPATPTIPILTSDSMAPGTPVDMVSDRRDVLRGAAAHEYDEAPHSEHARSRVRLPHHGRHLPQPGRHLRRRQRRTVDAPFSAEPTTSAP